MQTGRIESVYRPVEERIADREEVERLLSEEEMRPQAARCNGCGIPFCHGAGCPLGNLIPTFNAAVAKGRMRAAWDVLSRTAFFPEFTGRVCPALCEAACTRNLGDEPVMVRQAEKLIVETAFANGWVSQPAAVSNGKTAAVVGSGPAGLFAAEALRRKGYDVTVYERREKPGGLLRYGIPSWKLDKSVIDRRVALLEAAGIKFVCGAEIGVDVSPDYLRRSFDEIVLAVGTPCARDLPIPGRDAEGILFALDFLHGDELSGGKTPERFSAKGRKVLVVGGGDTGNDCVGKAIREGCASVLQIEFMPKPPETRSPSTPWPDWPYVLRTSYAQHEGGERRWGLSSKRFVVEDGRVKGVEAARVEWSFSPEGRPLKPTEVPGSEEFIEADLVVLAMGFVGVPREGIAEGFGLSLTPRGALVPDPANHVHAAGDCATGASLVVRAMAHAKSVVAGLP